MPANRVKVWDRYGKIATNTPFEPTVFSETITAAWSPMDPRGRRTLLLFVEEPHKSESRLMDCLHIRGRFEGYPILAVAIANVRELSASRRDGAAIVDAAVYYAVSRIEPARRCRRVGTRNVATGMLHVYLEAARAVHSLYRLSDDVTVPIYSEVAPDLWENVKEACVADELERSMPPREPSEADVESLSSLAP